MDEEQEEILSELPERLRMRIESLDRSDEHKEDIIKEFFSEKEKFNEEFGEELTKKYESRIEEVVIDLAILKKKLEEEAGK